MFFDASKEEEVSFEPLPIGLYTITCVAVEHGPTKAGDGSMLKVQWAVAGSDQQLFDNFTMTNPSEKAVKIGKGQLKTLCEMVGRPQLRVAEDLLGAVVRCEVFHKEYNGSTYANVKKYIKPMDAGAQANATPARQLTNAPAQYQTQQQSAPINAAPAQQSNAPAQNFAPAQQGSSIPF